MNKVLKNAVSMLTALLVAASSSMPMMKNSIVDNTSTVYAAASNYKFDFGGGGTANGYTGVSAKDAYSASKGYGFVSTGNVSNVSAKGSGAYSDAVQFNNASANNVFKVDLPKGAYNVKVVTGNVSRTSIKMEGMLQMINLTGNNAVETIQIPVTDGSLEIQACAGKSGTAYSISAVEITQVNTTGQTDPTIWICGDSTVCNYYNSSDSSQHGWGQFLEDYIDEDYWQVRNMAASGQYAKGFVDAGQFKAIEYYGKKGDVYIISIGINDTNYSDKDEYYKTVTDMVKKSKDKGVEVILVKQQGRRSDLQKNPLLNSRWFAGQLDQVGKEQNVEVMNLFKAWQDFGVGVGYAKMADYYAIKNGGGNDDLHQSMKGAKKLAELVAKLHDFKATGGTANPPATTQAPVVTTQAPVTTQGPSSSLTAEVFDESATYTFKNVNSGLYMEVAEQNAQSGANVQQWTKNGEAKHNVWKLKSAGNGYYYIYSGLSDTVVLDVSGNKATNGQNVGMYNMKESNNQQFKFTKNADGSYKIRTKVSGDASVVEVESGSTNTGANVQQWEANGSKCQDWFIEPVTSQQPVVTTQPTQPVVTTAPSVSSGLMYGDFTKDNKIDLTDLTLFSLYLLGDRQLSSELLTAADLDANGYVDIGDLATFKQYISKENVGRIGQFVNGGQTPSQPVQTQPAQTQPVQTQPSQPQLNVYPAVDATLNKAASEDTNAGYESKAYVNLDNEKGSSIEWTVNVQNNGNYLVDFRVANGSANDRAMKIEVNGDTTNYWIQPFLTTGEWTKWETRGIVLPLKAGANKIKAISNTDEGGPNIDYITLELTDEPIAEIYQPEQTPSYPQSDNPVIYIAGDSTVQSYKASYAPQQGWGYYLGNYFNKNVSVSNQAIAGRSSKSFYDNGRLDTILKDMKKGDYLLVQFGINDAASNKAERYAPVSGSVTNAKTGSFEYYMKKYIEGTIDKGGTPILVTTVIGLKAYSGGKFVNSYTGYCKAMKDLAAYYKIPCIDLNTLMVNHYNSIGYNKAKLYHLHGVVSGSNDMTHFSEEGANAVAKIVANAIKELNIPLSKSVK